MFIIFGLFSGLVALGIIVLSIFAFTTFIIGLFSGGAVKLATGNTDKAVATWVSMTFFLTMLGVVLFVVSLFS